MRTGRQPHLATSCGPTRPSASCCTWPRAIPESRILPGQKRPSDLSIWCCVPGCSQHLQKQHLAGSWPCPSPLPAGLARGEPPQSVPLPPSPCGQCVAAVGGLQRGMSLQQKVLERAQSQRVSPLQALLLQCIEIFPVLEWANGCSSTQKEADDWILFENFSEVEPGRGLFTGKSCYNKYPDASPRVCVFQYSWPFFWLLK